MCVQGTGKNSKEDDVSAERGQDAEDCQDHIPTVTIRLPYHYQKLTRTLFLTEGNRSIKQVFNLEKYYG
jgi:hypothetical protein